MNACQDFHQRGLAGAVFTDNGQDFAGKNLQGNSVQGTDSRKALADLLSFEERLP